MDVRCTRHTLTIQDQAFRLRQLVVEKRRSKSPRPSALRVGVRGLQLGVGATTVAKALHTCLRLWERKAEYIRAPKSKSPRGVAMEVNNLLPTVPQPIPSTKATQLAQGLFMHDPQAMPAGSEQLVWEVDRTHVATKPILEEDDGIGSICWIIVDCESGDGEASAPDWACFEAVVLVTTAEPLAVMAAYKWLKRFRDQGVPQRSIVVVNRTSDMTVGAEMGHRLQVACERFMAVSPPIAVLPEVAGLEDSHTCLTPMDHGKRQEVRIASGGPGHTEVWQSAQTWWKGIAGLTECVFRLVLAENSLVGDFATHRIGQDEGEKVATSTEENVCAGSVENVGEGKQPKDGEKR
ncbi:hypothetical protein [Thermogutta sp.]|uniref:MinD/ParA family ATP-binding protein n=1 Tax=Thermogutta sp. TaxID=1962930 RepID=UPI00321F885B